jgi:hypothetical protein
LLRDTGEILSVEETPPAAVDTEGRYECDPPCDCGDRCVTWETETEANLTMLVWDLVLRTAHTQNAWQDRPVTGDMIDARSGHTNQGKFVDSMGRPWLD